MKTRYITTDRIGKMHLLEAGKGELLLLLHGFPEFWYSWRHQVELLADRWHVVAPDLRGSGRTELTRERKSYELPALAADILFLVRRLGHDSATVIGHDWGGLVAWQYATLYPSATDAVVAMNAPHPAALARSLLFSPWKLLRSSYLAFLQLPWVPELLLGLGGGWPIRQVFRTGAGRKEVFSPDVLDAYVGAACQPGALHAALNYPRANTPYLLRNRRELARAVFPEDVPALLIWGVRDPFLSLGLIRETERVVRGLTVHRIPQAGHWVQQEAPDEVNQAILRFLAPAK